MHCIFNSRCGQPKAVELLCSFTLGDAGFVYWLATTLHIYMYTHVAFSQEIKGPWRPSSSTIAWRRQGRRRTLCLWTTPRSRCCFSSNSWAREIRVWNVACWFIAYVSHTPCTPSLTWTIENYGHHMHGSASMISLQGFWIPIPTHRRPWLTSHCPRCWRGKFVRRGTERTSWTSRRELPNPFGVEMISCRRHLRTARRGFMRSSSQFL